MLVTTLLALAGFGISADQVEDMVTRASRLQVEGRYDEAKVELSKATSVPSPGPDEWVVFEHLAKVYEKLGDEKNARANFEKATQLKSKP